MSCQECGLGDWLATGRPVPVGRMGWPALLEDQPAPQPCRPEWVEHGKLGWRGQTMLAVETSCGVHSTVAFM